MTDNATNELTEDNWRALTASVIRLRNERNATLADRDRLAVENARLRAALWEMLSHYAPDPDDDTEAADARAALADSGAAEQEA
jgi:hypothetical protein